MRVDHDNTFSLCPNRLDGCYNTAIANAVLYQRTIIRDIHACNNLCCKRFHSSITTQSQPKDNSNICCYSRTQRVAIIPLLILCCEQNLLSLVLATPNINEEIISIYNVCFANSLHKFLCLTYKLF